LRLAHNTHFSVKHAPWIVRIWAMYLKTVKIDPSLLALVRFAYLVVSVPNESDLPKDWTRGDGGAVSGYLRPSRENMATTDVLAPSVAELDTTVDIVVDLLCNEWVGAS
jgi:hypothetical protein